MKIAIVNDLPLAVEALRRTLCWQSAHEVVWVAGNGEDAVEMCKKERPDLILMDLIMPKMDGVEATRQIMAGTPCAILVVTVSVETNAGRVFEAMGHGALDAIDTPELSSNAFHEHAAPLLRKIDQIATLIQDKGQNERAIRQDSAGKKPIGHSRLVAIGASAGGPAALAKLLRGLPKDFPAAVVIVQHVDERFIPGMAAWLGDESALPVEIAQEGDSLATGRVWIAGTGDHLTLKDNGRLGYTPDPRDFAYRPSVNVFFESVSRLWRNEVIGVLLTGMGNDGALGLKALRDSGHHTIAQDQASSAVYGMPKAAAQMNAAVDILPLERIAAKLVSVFS